ncbi:unnamed protein product [Pelagomonas calceolata]|uniref:HTH La-type RNA-binding domain-containing protein n=2 Tax=Pelagomonas calceolata TaxID=35677 RepID=A0A8J2X273_9STRA|nr:unnamed protein product [Pelagomonas calceolata]
MAWRGHEASPPASPPRADYEAGHDGLDDLAVAALATLPPQKAASILTKLRNKGGNVRNPSAYVVRSVENAHCHGGGSLRPQPPPGAVYYVPYYNYGPPPPLNESPPGFEGFAPSPAAPAFVPQGVPYEAPGVQPPPPSGGDESDATDDGEQKDPCDALDPKASAALANLPEKEADRILDNLRRKGDAVRNPSAYVMRSILNSHAEVGCAYATEELPDIEEVPQAALHDAANCAACLECNEVALCPRKAAVDDALRAPPIRETGCSIAFATRGSAAVQAARCAQRWRARRPARPAAAPRPVEPPAEPSSGCGEACDCGDARPAAAPRPVESNSCGENCDCGDARPPAPSRPVDCGDCGDEACDCEKPGEASPVVGSPPSLPRSVLVCVGDCSVDEQARCGRRARVAKAVAQAAMQPGATQCAIVAGRAAVDADALVLALAELPESDAAAVADDELARGVALVQQVHHYLSPANLADDEYLRGLQEATGGYVDLAALAAFPNLAAMGADVASLARVLKHSRLVELDPTGTLVRPRPRESAA